MAKKTDKQAALARGADAEEQVADWYRRAGYAILARNWRCFEGEIDIIAHKDRTVVVCEVKARSPKSRMDPALSVGPAKQSKVRKATFRWLDENSGSGRVRFDVALVINGRIQMIHDAF